MIVVDRLTRRFQGNDVLRDLSLRIGAGERVALRGPNGAGKTTLLRCILGTLLPDGGSVTVDGHVAGDIAARRLVGASLSQERSFYLRLTGRENLLLYARLRGLGLPAARRHVAAIEEELELEAIADRRTSRCSTGQLQQLAVARALLGEPKVLLLDEPTRSLDAEARDRMWAAIERRAETTVVVATHVDEDTGHTTGVVQLHALADDDDE